jgi:hypothetical protein
MGLRLVDVVGCECVRALDCQVARRPAVAVMHAHTIAAPPCKSRRGVGGGVPVHMLTSRELQLWPAHAEANVPTHQEISCGDS